MKYIELDSVKYNIFDNSTDSGFSASDDMADIDVVLEDKTIEDIETAFKAVGSPLIVKENDDVEIARYYGLTKLNSIELKEKTNDNEETVRIATVHLTKPSLEETVEKNTSDIEELTNAIFALGAE